MKMTYYAHTRRVLISWKRVHDVFGFMRTEKSFRGPTSPASLIDCYLGWRNKPSSSMNPAAAKTIAAATSTNDNLSKDQEEEGGDES